VVRHCAVILDHGLYRDLDENFRTNFCRLWRALILLDGDEILETGRNLGAGQYARFLPIIFTGRSIERYEDLLLNVGFSIITVLFFSGAVMKTLMFTYYLLIMNPGIF
jgi:hypothetical protein